MNSKRVNIDPVRESIFTAIRKEVDPDLHRRLEWDSWAKVRRVVIRIFDTIVDELYEGKHESKKRIT